MTTSRKNRRRQLVMAIAAWVFTWLPAIGCLGQSYGLAFRSHEVIQDKRTSLELLPGTAYTANDNFDLSFDLAFLPGHKDYFGFVLRMVKDDHHSIDLVYEHPSPHFALVAGEGAAPVSFDIDPAALYHQWTRLTLSFDLAQDRLTLTVGDRSYASRGLGLKKGNQFRLYFGASQYRQFKVTDVPPMKVRDVRISENKRNRFHWPLNEREGNVAVETLAGKNGLTANPIWIKAAHFEWQQEAELVVAGYSSLAFDADKEQLYIAGTDSLVTFDAATSSLNAMAYASGPQPLLIGNQGLYTAPDHSIHSIYVDHQFVTSLSLENNRWNKQYRPGPVTDYWHFNKFFSRRDSSIYIIGGYGHYQYRNSVFRYKVPTGEFLAVDTKGDRLVPRYLAALGATRHGDTAYLLGGYGSQTGKQVVNPQNLYDLVRFEVSSNRFTRLFSLAQGSQEFVFANSLVINDTTRRYYALAFANYKYNSELQLIEGSLSGPSFREVGSRIPYSFHDITSFADLYYGERSQKFVAVTLLMDSLKRTRVRVFSLQGPAEADQPVAAAAPGGRSSTWLVYLWWLLVPVILAALYLVRKKRRPILPVEVPLGDPVLPVDDVPVSEPAPSPAASLRSSIFLFGEMQVIDREGQDITRSFTPLLKELFLLILLYTLQKGRGISSEKLNEILWFDKSAQSARNNRSVNIAKLKTILERLGECVLSKDTGYWRIEFNYEEITVDFRQYLEIVRDREHLDKERLLALAAITQSGNFLANLEYEWLDDFKSQVSNGVIDTYLHYAQSVPISADADLFLKISEYIFTYDPVNEEALTIRCRALAQLGKHTQAKNAYDQFAREYHQLYGEDFSRGFKEVMG